MKKTIRLNESEFRNMIMENVNRILNEDFDDSNTNLSNKLRKIADWLEKDSTNDYSSIYSAINGYEEENDPHFNDDEQIAKDKENDWRNFESEPLYYDNKHPRYSKTPKSLPDYNNNVDGKAYYGDMSDMPYDSGLSSMAAMSDKPFDKWYGQTDRGTEKDFFDASRSWFPADIDNTELPDGTHRISSSGKIDGLHESVRRAIRKYLK